MSLSSFPGLESDLGPSEPEVRSSVSLLPNFSSGVSMLHPLYLLWEPFIPVLCQESHPIFLPMTLKSVRQSWDSFLSFLILRFTLIILQGTGYKWLLQKNSRERGILCKRIVVSRVSAGGSAKGILSGGDFLGHIFLYWSSRHYPG